MAAVRPSHACKILAPSRLRSSSERIPIQGRAADSAQKEPSGTESVHLGGRSTARAHQPRIYHASWTGDASSGPGRRAEPRLHVAACTRCRSLSLSRAPLHRDLLGSLERRAVVAPSHERLETRGVARTLEHDLQRRTRAARGSGQNEVRARPERGQSEIRVRSERAAAPPRSHCLSSHYHHHARPLSPSRAAAASSSA